MTPSEREQKIAEIKARVERRSPEPGVPSADDTEVAFLLDCLTRKDQEHAEEVAQLRRELKDEQSGRALERCSEFCGNGCVGHIANPTQVGAPQCRHHSAFAL